MLVVLLLFVLFLALNGRLGFYGSLASIAGQQTGANSAARAATQQPAGSVTGNPQSGALPNISPEAWFGGWAGALLGTGATSPGTAGNPLSRSGGVSVPSWAPGAYNTWGDWFSSILGTTPAPQQEFTPQ